MEFWRGKRGLPWDNLHEGRRSVCLSAGGWGGVGSPQQGGAQMGFPLQGSHGGAARFQQGAQWGPPSPGPPAVLQGPSMGWAPWCPGPCGQQGRGAAGRPGPAKFLGVGDDLAWEGVSHGTWGTLACGRVWTRPGLPAPSQGLACTVWGHGRAGPGLCPWAKVPPRRC